MKMPSVRPESFALALELFNRKPLALMQTDSVLHRHCQETSIRAQDPLLALNTFTLAAHTLQVECQRFRLPPCEQRVVDDVMRELLELGAQWDDEMLRRLASDHRNFHTVFDGFARKKEFPALALHQAAKAFRIFELRLQAL